MQNAVIKKRVYCYTPWELFVIISLALGSNDVVMSALKGLS